MSNNEIFSKTMKYFYKNEIFFHLGVDGVVLSGDPGHGFLQHGNVVISPGWGRGGTLQVQTLQTLQQIYKRNIRSRSRLVGIDV